jgi:hypothetical protein
MPDNWSFVFAAYALAAVVLGGYWRNLIKRERAATQPRASLSAHPRSKPAPRP